MIFTSTLISRVYKYIMRIVNYFKIYNCIKKYIIRIFNYFKTYNNCIKKYIIRIFFKLNLFIFQM